MRFSQDDIRIILEDDCGGATFVWFEANGEVFHYYSDDNGLEVDEL